VACGRWQSHLASGTNALFFIPSCSCIIAVRWGTPSHTPMCTAAHSLGGHHLGHLRALTTSLLLSFCVETRFLAPCFSELSCVDWHSRHSSGLPITVMGTSTRSCFSNFNSTKLLHVLLYALAGLLAQERGNLLCFCYFGYQQGPIGSNQAM
jgi:hypothetical protein